MKKSAKNNENHTASNNAEAFTIDIGDPIPMLDRSEILGYFESTLMYDKYYNPPVSFASLSKLRGASSYHESAIDVKKNILLSTITTTNLLSYTQLEKFVLDFLFFGNAYLQVQRNRFGEPLKVTAPLAKYVRVGVEQGKYYQVVNGVDDYEFPADSIFHLCQPDLNQEIYGIPSYLGALQSLLLNESATLFRRKYYVNGAHAGSIIYANDAGLSQEGAEELKKQLKQAKGRGNFKNLFVHIPAGKDGGIKVIPLSDAVGKDEFLNIKNTSRDDILAAHRVPPQLMGIIPTNTGGFGDVEKAAKVFCINEITILQRRLEEINTWLGRKVIKFGAYKLLEDS
ncbi:phage portal protein [Pasteurella skyensis]|uniref:Phage portal protein n=1 Tax=Phocoenobacter skyensis TaxID=97481 RepID=A0AAJ6P0X5_9PAST|nr:phage portal protein [Pasteurella skyensis]MDP8173114.1 phage portal protein [Pasteurella skyensis]MDP8176337.1 phage portal protein [Pasteurella skyensis]MDP8178953.1 phage portal protein [Pasteurella skyensis]MDP8199150.1 phage portal protein [Pasteurella skyensis]